MILEDACAEFGIMVDGARASPVLVDNILNLRVESIGRGLVTFGGRAKKNFTNSSPMV